MARAILEEPGEDITVGGSDVDVIGTSTGGEQITIFNGNVTLDASFNTGGDIIALPGDAEDYVADIVGSRLVLTSDQGSGATVSIPVGPNEVELIFLGISSPSDDDSRSLAIVDGDPVIGDQVIEDGDRLDENSEAAAARPAEAQAQAVAFAAEASYAAPEPAAARAAVDAFEQAGGLLF